MNSVESRAESNPDEEIIEIFSDTMKISDIIPDFAIQEEGCNAISELHVLGEPHVAWNGTIEKYSNSSVLDDVGGHLYG
jgi:hypothetical protein